MYPNSEKIRIGIDFGYKYTGIALLNQKNKVLDYSVIQLRTNISDILLNRRTNRSSRRRKKTQKIRLKKFYAFLKGIGIEPQTKNKKFIGNKLYAIAHKRGWDYSSLIELLINDKKQKTPTVIKIDKLLIEKFNAPYSEEIKTIKGETNIIKKINNTCLGELVEYQKIINNNNKILNKKRTTKKEQQKAQAEIEQAKQGYEKLYYKLENAGVEEIKEYICERLEKSNITANQQKKALEYILVILGLNIGTKLHNEGKLYTPHKNRHRNEFIKELKEKINLAFNEPSVIKKATVQAKKQNRTTDYIKEYWLKNAIAILDPNNPERGNPDRKKNNKDVRPARFQNRHIGKCPVTLKNGTRCNSNLPKKSRKDIRELQFEIEARQINIKDPDIKDNKRKLTDDELSQLMQSVDFDKHQLLNDGENWENFFTIYKTPKVKGETRGKKEVLKDIASGPQAGRSNLCTIHLQEKLDLIKNQQTESSAWERLHQERILNIYNNDAPPSIRQKIEVTIQELKKMLRKQDYNLNNLPVEHIGIETARFDISALAQNEGRKLKSKNYQKKARRNIEELKEEQESKCLYCGQNLGFATIDHIFPKSLHGSDKALNRAVAHDICNINKGKSFVEIKLNVLESIKEKNLPKYKFIKQGIKNNWHKADKSFATKQNTMFGAKLLKGSLITALNLEQLSTNEIKSLFPKIKPRETNYLRKNWFPFMDKQKSSIRYKSEKIKTIKILIGDNKIIKPLRIFWAKKLSENIKIQLENPEKIKNWITYETKNNKTIITIDNNHKFKKGDENILSYRFNAIDKQTGEIKQYQKVHIVIQPDENDPINEFHHALDAIIVASNINWSKLNSINNKLNISNKAYYKKFAEAIQKIYPNVQLNQIKIEGESQYQYKNQYQYIAPDRKHFFKKNKQEQSKIKCTKTDTQALRLKDNKLTQRKRLYDIAKKNVKTIQSHRIKSLMLKAFSDINKMSDNDKKIYLSKSGKDLVTITQDYFLTFPKKHPLHPTKTRGVRCKSAGVSDKQLFEIVDKNKKTNHFYKRTIAWDKVIVYKNPAGKIKTERFVQNFYVNQYNPQIKLPKGAKIIEEFKRGDIVKIKKKPKSEIWKIEKLGKSANLGSILNETKKTCTYKKLRHKK